MLHTTTIAQGTLQLLRRLCAEDLLADFNLVGGTALALQIGHRVSVDLDFFGRTTEFDTEQLRFHLQANYGLITLLQHGKTLIGQIGGVKVDFIAYPYPLLDEPIATDGVRMCSLRDIAAMKLSAITQNGTRLKDFVDLAYLSPHLSFHDMLDAYQAKYDGSSPLSPMKALTYFDDIDFTATVAMTDGPLDWPIVARRLYDMVQEPGQTKPLERMHANV